MRNVIQVILLLLIVLALLAVFTLSTFRPLGGGKVDDAHAKAEQLRIYEKTYSTRNDRKHVEDLSDLAAYAEDGDKAIIDPWGKRFQFRYVIDPKSGREQFVVWTVRPDGTVLAAPPEAAEWIGPRDAPR